MSPSASRFRQETIGAKLTNSSTESPSFVKKPTNPVLRVLWFAFSAALAVFLIAWLIPAALSTSWHSVFESLQNVSFPLVLLLLALAVLALLADSVGFAASFGALRLLTFTRLNAISQAVTLALPFGSTISLGIIFIRLKQLGLSLGRITAGISIASIADVLALVFVSLLALFYFSVTQLPEATPAWLQPALLALAIALIALSTLLLFVLSSNKIFNQLLKRLESVLAAFDEGFNSEVGAESLGSKIAKLRQFREQAIAHFRKNYVLLLGAPLLARFLQGIAFALATVWLSDGTFSFVTALAIFGISRLLAIVPLTPGGIGVVDAALVALLVFYGLDSQIAIAIALLFTTTHVIFPAVLGGLLLPFQKESKVS